MKTLLLLVTALCLLLAYLSEPLMVEHRNRRILAELESKGVKTSIVGLIHVDQTLRRTLVSYFGVPAYPHQYSLDFSGAKLEEVDLKPLNQLYTVSALNFRGTKLNDRQLDQIAASPFLQTLDISQTQVTEEAIEKLERFRNLASLEVVGTSVAYPVLDKLDSLLEFAHFAEKKAIAEFDAAGFQLVDTPRILEFEQIFSLIRAGQEATYAYVSGSGQPIPFTPTHVEHLNHLTSLTDIGFHTVQLGSEGLSHLRPLPELNILEFWFVNLQDADLEAIARQTQLERLQLHYADEITDAGIIHLGALKKLQSLRISDCPGLTEQTIDKLRRQLPDCQIEFTTW